MIRRSLSISALTGLLLVTQTHAATFTVTRTNDPVPDGCQPTDCSVREAILDANGTAQLDQVVIPAGTYQFSYATGASLFVTAPVLLQGAGATATTLNAETGGAFLFFRAAAAGSIVSDLTFSGDAATVQSGSQVDFRACRVIAGTALGFDNSGTSTFEDCSFGGIDALIAGIRNNAGGHLSFRRSTYDSSSSFGAALLNQGTAVLENCTIHGGSSFMATIDNRGSLSIRNCTLVLPLLPDGIPAESFTNTGTVELANTILRGTCAGTAPVDAGGNLEGPQDSCGLDDATSQVAVADLGLGGLADNGGPTKTRALLEGSPAIGTAVVGTCPATDQRGEARPLACDSGAYESNPTGGCTASVASESGSGAALGTLLLAAMMALRTRRRAQDREIFLPRSH